MAQPNNYSLNLPDPTQSIMAGAGNALQLAGGIQSFQANEAALAKAQAAAERQKQMQADFGALYDNPTVEGINKISIKYPEMSEHLDRIHGNISEAEKEERIGQGFKFAAALTSEDPEEAVRMAQEQAVAYRNKGMEAEAKEMEDLAALTKADRKQAILSTNMALSKLAGPEKFAETLSKLETDRRMRGLEGAELTEAQAKAHTAAVESEFALSNAVMEQQKKGWDITKIMLDHDIAKENSRIAAMAVDATKANTQVKRDQLNADLEAAKLKREEMIRVKTAEVENARGSMDNMLNTIENVLNTPVGVLDDITGTIDSNLFTLGAAEAKAEAEIAKLGDQAFLAQLPSMKGFGSLSNAEKDALKQSLQSFSLKLDTPDLIANVKEAGRLVRKMRDNLAVEYGVPNTRPDTPSMASPSKEERESLRAKYGVAVTGGSEAP